MNRSVQSYHFLDFRIGAHHTRSFSFGFKRNRSSKESPQCLFYCRTIRKEAMTSANSSKEAVVPDFCFCPVSLEVMSDPISVDTADCRCVVDRSTFEAWVLKRGNNSCPVCLSDLLSHRVKPIPVLRDAIRCAQSQNWTRDYEDDNAPLAQPTLLSTTSIRLDLKSVPPQVATMIRQLANAKTAGMAAKSCKRIENAARGSPRNRGHIGKTGGIPLIIAAMQQYSESMAMQQHACAVLWNLAYNNAGNSVTVGGAGGIEVIVSVMERYKDTAAIQEQACAPI